MKNKLKKILFFHLPLSILFWIFSFPLCLFSFDVHAATITWDGGGDGVNWSDANNWAGDIKPGTADIALFNDTSDNSAIVDAGISVAGISVNSGYDGILTQNSTITVGGSGFSMATGVFIGGIDVIDINGSFTLASGANFTSTSGELRIEHNLTISSTATFSHNNGVIKFDGGYTGSTSINAPNIVFNKVVINRTYYNGSTNGDATLTIAAGTTLPLGENPTITLNAPDDNDYWYHLTNNGTITASGTIDSNVRGNFTFGSGSTFFAPDTANLNIDGSLIVNTNATFSGFNTLSLDGGYTFSTTISLPGISINKAIINRTYYNGSTNGDATLTIAAGTTLPLGENPTITLNAPDDNDDWYHLTNNGTITASGTVNVYVRGIFTNNSIVIFPTLTTLTSSHALMSMTNSLSGVIQAVATLTIMQFKLTNNGSATFSSFVIGSGGIYSGAGNTILSGDFTNSGTFNHGNGTVILAGTDQTLTGTTTFYNLTKEVTSTSTLTYGANQQFTIAGTWTMRGNAPDARLFLESSQSGTPFIIKTTGTRSIAYLSVKDSANTAPQYIDASDGTNLDEGGNYNWDFTGNGADYSGSLYWTGLAGNNTWNDAMNWDQFFAPTSINDVFIEKTTTINLTAPTTVHSLTIGTSTATTSITLNFAYDAFTAGPLVVNGGDMTVYSGGIVTHSAGTSTVVGRVNVEVTDGDLTIETDAMIHGNGKGYGSTYGPGAGQSFSCCNNRASGAGHGGDGGDGGRDNGNVYGVGGGTYGSTTTPTTLGSGGGYEASGVGGSGGGSISLKVSGITTLKGKIEANASSGSGGWSGGGSGGSIYVDTGSLSGNGTIRTWGGSGSGEGGQGGGGRIAIYYSDQLTPELTISSFGGAGSTGRKGAAGTIYLKGPSSIYGDLIVDNNGSSTIYATTKAEGFSGDINLDRLILRNKGTFLIPSGKHLSYDSVEWNSGGILVIRGTVNFPNDMTIPSGATLALDAPRTFNNLTVLGVLTHSANKSVASYGLNVTVLGDLSVPAGGAINVLGKGYTLWNGPGKGNGSWGCCYQSGGAGYGGDGGSAGLAGGSSYGSIIAPIDMGVQVVLKMDIQGALEEEQYDFRFWALRFWMEP